MNGNFSADANVTANSVAAVIPLLITVAFVLAVIGIAIAVYTNQGAFNRFAKLFGRARHLPGLVIEGIVGTVPVAALGVPIYYFATATPDTQSKTLLTLLIIVSSIVALACYGYFVRKLRKRLQARFQTFKELNQ